VRRSGEQPALHRDQAKGADENACSTLLVKSVWLLKAEHQGQLEDARVGNGCHRTADTTGGDDSVRTARRLGQERRDGGRNRLRLRYGSIVVQNIKHLSGRFKYKLLLDPGRPLEAASFNRRRP